MVEDRIDGIVVMLLFHFMTHGEDVKSDIPMSEKLHYQITHYLIPALSKASKGKLKSIDISAPLINKKLNGISIAATGISCGVDSFCAIYEHLNCEESYRVQLLAYFNNGAFNGGYKFSEAEMREYFYESGKNAQSFAKGNGFEFLMVDSNLNEFSSSVYSQDHTYRTLGMAMLFQGYIGKYYYAGGHAVQDNVFHVDTEEDCANYDILTIPFLETENICLYPQALALKRYEKNQMISNYEPAYQYLQVCVRDTSNCSVCEKCGRTLLTLEALNLLPKYRNVFDIEKYKANRTKIMGRMLSSIHQDIFAKDNYQLLKQNKIHIPITAYVLSVGYMAKRKVKAVLVKVMPRKIKDRIKKLLFKRAVR